MMLLKERYTPNREPDQSSPIRTIGGESIRAYAYWKARAYEPGVEQHETDLEHDLSSRVSTYRTLAKTAMKDVLETVGFNSWDYMDSQRNVRVSGFSWLSALEYIESVNNVEMPGLTEDELRIKLVPFNGGTFTPQEMLGHLENFEFPVSTGNEEEHDVKVHGPGLLALINSPLLTNLATAESKRLMDKYRLVKQSKPKFGMFKYIFNRSAVRKSKEQHKLDLALVEQEMGLFVGDFDSGVFDYELAEIVKNPNQDRSGFITPFIGRFGIEDNKLVAAVLESVNSFGRNSS